METERVRICKRLIQLKNYLLQYLERIALPDYNSGTATVKENAIFVLRAI